MKDYSLTVGADHCTATQHKNLRNILCAIVYLTSKETSQTAAMPMDFASVDDHVRETTQKALSEILKKKL